MYLHIHPHICRICLLLPVPSTFTVLNHCCLCLNYSILAGLFPASIFLPCSPFFTKQPDDLLKYKQAMLTFLLNPNCLPWGLQDCLLPASSTLFHSFFSCAQYIPVTLQLLSIPPAPSVYQALFPL